MNDCDGNIILDDEKIDEFARIRDAIGERLHLLALQYGEERGINWNDIEIDYECFSVTFISRRYCGCCPDEVIDTHTFQKEEILTVKR